MVAGSDPSQSTELAVLSSVINAAILSVLLTGERPFYDAVRRGISHIHLSGIYTTVYFAAIYLYRK